MNRTQAERRQGNYVRLTHWPFKPNFVETSHNRVYTVQEYYSKRPIFILNKVTKAGLCLISQDGWKDTLSVAPSDICEWANKNCPVNFWTIENVQKHIITQNDIDDGFSGVEGSYV